MRIAIAGAGPVGLFTALTLARRGHTVDVVDRDPGPAADGSWSRVGVMQFLHPHGFRPQVRWALQSALPDVYDELLAAGAEVRRPPGAPEDLAGMYCRRSVVESTLRRAAHRESGLRWITGHVDRVLVSSETARGLQVDGAQLDAEVVIVATGRSSRLGDEFRGPVEGGSCGFSYLSRMYRARPGRPGCDLPAPSLVVGPDYYSLVLPQDNGTHSLLLCFPTSARDTTLLRTDAGFDRAAAAVPNLAPWADPVRFEPLTGPLVGAHLTNTYRLQGPALGLPPARGLLFLGDAVATMNPLAGRYLSLALPQVLHLLAVLDDPTNDLFDASLALDLWAEQNIRPWYLDHVRWDRTMLHRFAGRRIDVAEPIPSDVICAAAAVDPSIAPLAGQYSAMTAGPAVLAPAEQRVRDLLRQGWHPASVGPSLAEIGGVVPASAS